MPLLLRDIRLELEDSEDRLPELAAKRLGVDVGAIRNWAIVRRSVDARKRAGPGRASHGVQFSYHLELALNESERNERRRLRSLKTHQASWIGVEREEPVEAGSETLPQRPIIIGFGPAGMFAALMLARMGYRPLVLERGREVRRRHRDVMHRFYRFKDFDSESNLLFGEGGAGTYSDGKLYTRISEPLVRTVLEELYWHGADPDILINARPHIGSDRLPTICTRIRRRIESLGGEVQFEAHVEDIEIKSGRLDAIHVRHGAQESIERLSTGPTVLAVGHSARDTIRMLIRRGVRVDPKAFQIGVRIEHPQEQVDRWQYGAAAGHPKLGAAEYYVVAKGASEQHGDMFSFCMCPGGVILPTNQSPELIATNGASRANRSGCFANSGLVITIGPETFGPDALAGLAYQEKWERLAFETTGRTYELPVQRACDYLAQKASDGALEVSYPFGGRWAEIRSVIPKEVAGALDRALPVLDARMPGYAGGEAIITAPETRASAPFRIVRDTATRQAIGVEHLYPVGEGAGYAGGIISAAVDGIKAARKIISAYAPPA